MPVQEVLPGAGLRRGTHSNYWIRMLTSLVQTACLPAAGLPDRGDSSRSLFTLLMSHIGLLGVLRSKCAPAAQPPSGFGERDKKRFQKVSLEYTKWASSRSCFYFPNILSLQIELSPFNSTYDLNFFP